MILAVVLGLALAAGAAALATPLLSLMGGRGAVGQLAVLCTRTAALGLLVRAPRGRGSGLSRGVSRLRLPLAILLGGNVLNAILEVLCVYSLDWVAPPRSGRSSP